MQGMSRAAYGQPKKPGSMLAAHRGGRVRTQPNTTEPAPADLGCTPDVDSSSPPDARVASSWDVQCMSSLVKTIECEIIPRLVLAHRPSGAIPSFAEGLGK